MFPKIVVSRLELVLLQAKKIGNAVQRNRARRLIRESVRHLTEDIKDGYDFVFVARAKTPFVKCPEVQRSMRKQLKEAGVLK